MFDHRTMRQSRLCSVVAIIATLSYGSMGNAQDAAATAAVTRAINCLSDSWNAHDMAAFGQCFAADADFVNDTGRLWKGRTVIQKNHAFLHGTVDTQDITATMPSRVYGIYKASILTFTSITMRFVRPDNSIVHAAWQITGDARTPEPRTGMMTIVVNNESGHWYIVALQNTETPRTVK
jgi:uncharacterized protein (TIGR02246 family)